MRGTADYSRVLIEDHGDTEATRLRERAARARLEEDRREDLFLDDVLRTPATPESVQAVTDPEDWDEQHEFTERASIHLLDPSPAVEAQMVREIPLRKRILLALVILVPLMGFIFVTWFDVTENDTKKVLLPRNSTLYDPLIIKEKAIDKSSRNVGDRVSYLTSEGLGYTAFVVYTAVSVVPKVLAKLVHGVSISNPSRQSVKGLSRSRIRGVFAHGRSTWAGRFRVVGKLLRAIFNNAMILQRFAARSRRNPTVRLNEAHHLVAWVELLGPLQFTGWLVGIVLLLFREQRRKRIVHYSVMSLSVVWLLTETIFLCAFRTRDFFRVVFIGFAVLRVLFELPLDVASMVSRLDEAARFSILNYLSYLSPGQVQSHWNTVKHLGEFAFVIVGGSTMFYLFLAGASLVVKLAQLDFVADTRYFNWEYGQWLNLLAFANNIIGIINVDALALKGIFEQMRQDEGLVEDPVEIVQADWLRSFGKAMGVEYGAIRSVFIVAGASPEEIAKMLREAVVFDRSHTGIDITIEDLRNNSKLKEALSECKDADRSMSRIEGQFRKALQSPDCDDAEVHERLRIYVIQEIQSHDLESKGKSK